MYDVGVVDKKVDGIGPWICTKSDLAATWGIIVKDWEEYLKDTLLSICTKRGTAIQAGGHQGIYPRLLSEHFKMVYTFEPHPSNFFCLYQNCFQKENIKMFQCALGDEKDLVSNCYFPANIGMNKVVNEKEFNDINKDRNLSYDESPTVPQLTLSSFLLKDVDLIYLDVEGYEPKVLKGGMDIIKQYSPVIVLEKPTEETIKFMEDIGYKLKTKIGITSDSFFVKE